MTRVTVDLSVSMKKELEKILDPMNQRLVPSYNYIKDVNGYVKTIFYICTVTTGLQPRKISPDFDTVKDAILWARRNLSILKNFYQEDQRAVGLYREGRD